MKLRYTTFEDNDKPATLFMIDEGEEIDVAEFVSEITKEEAEFICHCVNNFDKLQAENKEMKEGLNKAYAEIQRMIAMAKEKG